MKETIGNCTLYHGDCLEVIPTLSPVNFILTDPPYGTTACSWDIVIPFDKMWACINRIIKQNACIALFGSEPFSSYLRISNIKNYKYDWIWNKNKAQGFFNAKKMPLRNVENISIFYYKSCVYNPQGTIKCKIIKNNSTLINKCYNLAARSGGALKTNTHIQTVAKYPKQIIEFSTEIGLHPTQKPVPLLEYLIKTYTNENDIVLDFTMGSGSTGVACLNTNRRFIGIEKDKKYFDIACKRIKEAISQTGLFAETA